MTGKYFHWLTVLFFCGGLASNSIAATFEYQGTVETTTGAFTTLVPLGSPVGLVYVVDDAAVASGLVGPNDIESVNLSLGLFCFSTESPYNCPQDTAAIAPISSLDAELSFANGIPTGGFLEIVSFPPTLPPFFVDIDLTSGVFLAEVSMLGTLSGSIGEVPVPATVWLFGSALFGLLWIRGSDRPASPENC